MRLCYFYGKGDHKVTYKNMVRQSHRWWRQTFCDKHVMVCTPGDLTDKQSNSWHNHTQTATKILYAAFYHICFNLWLHYNFNVTYKSFCDTTVKLLSITFLYSTYPNAKISDCHIHSVCIFLKHVWVLTSLNIYIFRYIQSIKWQICQSKHNTQIEMLHSISNI